MRRDGAHEERRRLVCRPRNGDVRPCPLCGARSEFCERWRFEGQSVPAWVCDSPTCRQQDLVRLEGTQRRPPSSAEAQTRGLRRSKKAIEWATEKAKNQKLPT